MCFLNIKMINTFVFLFQLISKARHITHFYLGYLSLNLILILFSFISITQDFEFELQ